MTDKILEAKRIIKDEVDRLKKEKEEFEKIKKRAEEDIHNINEKISDLYRFD